MRKDDRRCFQNQAPRTLNVAVDVGLDEVFVVTNVGDGLIRRQVANRSDSLRMLCQWLKQSSHLRGFAAVRLVVEPTGIYHELLLAIGRQFGFETRLVQAEAVKKNRVVLFGDYGKTDHRDPEVILDLAGRGLLIRDRQIPETFQALRNAGVIYARAERDAVRAKCRIHRARRRIFPDFPMSTDFLFSTSGEAVMRVTGLDPHAITRLSPKQLTQRIRRHAPRIRQSSIDRLRAAAELSGTSIPATPATALTLLELRQAWDDLHLADARKAEAADHLLALYDEARLLDRTLPPPQSGLVSKLNLARLVAETGPWSHFDSVSQLLKYIGLNLFENQSGRSRGKTKISKKGRSLARHVLSLIVVPLVRRGRLLASYHHYKTKVEKKPGPVAITAAARKTLNILFGWGRSGKAFDPARVFICESQIARAA
jgi:transposase